MRFMYFLGLLSTARLQLRRASHGLARHQCLQRTIKVRPCWDVGPDLRGNMTI